MKRTVLAIAVVALAAGSLSADVVYSSGGSIGEGLGLGAGATNGAAETFTPSQNYDLTTIQIPLSWITGTNSATIAIAGDSGGLPGTTLESWGVGPLPTHNGSVPANQVVTDTLSLVLNSGTKYWLEVLPPSGPSGLEADFQSGSGTAYWNQGGTWNNPVTGTFNAEVDGTVVASATPEPGTFGLIGLAGLALAYLRRRKA